MLCVCVCACVCQADRNLANEAWAAIDGMNAYIVKLNKQVGYLASNTSAASPYVNGIADITNAAKDVSNTHIAHTMHAYTQ